MNILVTGAAGFIGFHLSKALIDRKDSVIGIDNINDYYDIELKKSRLDNINQHENASFFKFVKADISDRKFMEDFFTNNKFDIVINLAAQAGVRYSLEKPYKYVDSNLIGFMNILEGCRHSNIQHLIYASSSSVYGMNEKQPFHIDDRVDNPISLYAATKKSNELMAYSYSHLYKIPTTGLRFFTVYGPYGRPDMAYFKFTKNILNGDPINVFNNGDMRRDFTYIDDVIEGIVKTIDQPITAKDHNIQDPYRLFNLGNNKPVSLSQFIKEIEDACNKKAIKKFLPMQQGDVYETYADIDNLIETFGYKPETSIRTGIANFVDWYKSYYLC